MVSVDPLIFNRLIFLFFAAHENEHKVLIFYASKTLVQ